MDVGASCIAETPVYKTLLDEGLAHLNAFEGDPRQIDEIRRFFSGNVSIFNDFLADGTERTLYVCNKNSGMTSLLKPNERALKFFNGFDRFGHVIGTEIVKTKRLDDVTGIPKIDFLKMDIQGSELCVLKNGPNTLSECMAIQLEVSYICLYEGQPPFGEIDIWMRDNGYVPHCFLDVKRWSISPTIKNDNFRIPFNQLLESDIVYIKNPMNLDIIDNDSLVKMAIISHYCFSSYDLCAHIMHELVSRGALGADSIQDYFSIASPQ